MRWVRAVIVAIPLLASVAGPVASPAQARHYRDGGGDALAAALIGLAAGAVAGSAFAPHEHQYEPAYAPPAYAFQPAYLAPPPIVYPRPTVVYQAPPPIVYAPAPRAVYVRPRVYAVRQYAPPPATVAGWEDDD